VATPEPLDVVGVNRAAVDGGDRLVDLAGFLVRVSVDANRDVIAFRDG